MSLENKTGQELVPIELRAHHINGVLRASKKTIEEYASSMILGWYVLSKEDEFVDKTYSFIKTLVENPETRVKVVVGKKDFICDICRWSNLCFAGAGEPNYSRADRETLCVLGLKEGEVYRINKLIDNFEYFEAISDR